jgi:ClpP class serine protease
VAASGGYMLALAGDEIYAHEASILGSIGVVYSGFGFNKALEKLGIERRLYTAGEQKSLLDPFSPESKEDIERLKHIQGEIHEYFKSKVRERRGKRLKGPRAKLFSGEVWLGKEAQKLGVIDGTAEMRSFLKERFGEKVRIRTIKQKKEPFGLLSLLRGVETKENISISSDKLSNSSWSDDVLETIETRASWDRWGL